MLSISKADWGGVTRLTFSGVFDASADLKETIGQIHSGEVHVYCRDIPRFTSMGIVHWMKYFSSLARNGVKLKFFECPGHMVEQLGLINNFTCGGTIESVFLPFTCQGCKKEKDSLFQTKDLKKYDVFSIEIPCDQCGGKLHFDDLPEIYLKLLHQGQRR